MGTPSDLEIALAQNTDLKALVVHGYHDLGANYFLSRFLLEQALVTPSARQRLTFHNYPGGHMFHLNKKSRAELAADVHGFFEGQSGTGKSAPPSRPTARSGGDCPPRVPSCVHRGGVVWRQYTANSALQPSLTHTVWPSLPQERPYVQGLRLRCL